MLNGELDPEQEVAVEQRRSQAVDADRRHRERHREKDEREVGRCPDQQLQRPVPALTLHGPTRGRARRRPHPHHGRAERCVEQCPRALPRAEDEERDRGEEERVEDLPEALERRPGDHLHVVQPAHPKEAEDPHSSVTRAT
jgi:hypothetical protein